MARQLSKMALLFITLLPALVSQVAGSLHDLADRRSSAAALRLVTGELPSLLEDVVEPAFSVPRGGGGAGNLRGTDEAEPAVVTFISVAEATTTTSSFVSFIVILVTGSILTAALCIVLMAGLDRSDKGVKQDTDGKLLGERSWAVPPGSMPAVRSGSWLPPPQRPMLTSRMPAPLAQTLLGASTAEGTLSETLFVTSPDGGNFVIGGEIGPHPEEDIISVVDAKTGGIQAKVFISETGSNPAIHIETSNHVPVAVMDTSCAIYAEDTEPPERRFVNVHKSGGAPFARIHTEWGDGQCACVVQRVGPNGNPSGLLLMVRYDENEEMRQAVGPSGEVVARPQAMRNPDGSESRFLWVKQGADFGLVLCAALAFRKLS